MSGPPSDRDCVAGGAVAATVAIAATAADDARGGSQVHVDAPALAGDCGAGADADAGGGDAPGKRTDCSPAAGRSRRSRSARKATRQLTRKLGAARGAIARAGAGGALPAAVVVAVADGHP